MDFGDILNQWADQQKASARQKKQPQVSHKKANAPTAEEKAARAQGYTAEQLMAQEAKKTVVPMDLWLRRYGVVDKDRIAQSHVQETNMRSPKYLRSLPPDAKIDLHGLTRDEAWAQLDEFVRDCKRRGLKKILIVHGKGNHSHENSPVLGAMVRTFIECTACLGMSGHPDGSQGGAGATWVILK